MAAVPGLTDEEKAAIIAEASQDSDVPIVLNIGSQMDMSSTTRAPLESDDNNLFTTDGTGNYLGVFCLAQTKQPQAPEVAVATNSITWDGETPLGSLDPNMKTSVSLLEEKDSEDPGYDGPNIIGTVRTDNAISEIRFWEGEDRKVLYYPSASWYNYHFYAYYPRQESGVTSNSKTVTVDYELNGTKDIIWGKAVPTTTTAEADPESDVDRAFNAKYFRDKADAEGLNSVDQLPKLSLNHCLAQVRFWIKVAAADAGYYDTYVTSEGNELKLKNIEVINMPNQWRLTVADKTTPANEGKFTFNGDADDVGTVGVKNMTVNAAGKATASTDFDRFDINNAETYRDVTKEWGACVGYVMIPTTDMYAAAHALYSDIPAKPQAKIRMKVGDDDVELGNLTLPDPTTASGKYDAGKVYNIRLDLTIPRPRAASAELTTWGALDVTSEDDHNVDMQIGNE